VIFCRGRVRGTVFSLDDSTPPWAHDVGHGTPSSALSCRSFVYTCACGSTRGFVFRPARKPPIPATCCVSALHRVSVTHNLQTYSASRRQCYTPAAVLLQANIGKRRSRRLTPLASAADTLHLLGAFGIKARSRVRRVGRTVANPKTVQLCPVLETRGFAVRRCMTGRRFATCSHFGRELRGLNCLSLIGSYHVGDMGL